MAKKEEISGVEIHSEEVQDILGSIPGRLINWGVTIIFSIFLILIGGSYFFSFNEIVTAPMVITTSYPPAPLIANTSGRISKWYVTDGQTVTQGSLIAMINNPAQIADVMELEQVVGSLNGKVLSEMVVMNTMPDNLMLGDMQVLYDKLLKNWRGYRHYVTDKPLLKSIELHKLEMDRYENIHNLSLRQMDLVEKEFELAKKRYERDQSLVEIGGVTEYELENVMSSLIQSERAYFAFKGSLESMEVGMIGQQRALLEMQEQHRSNMVQFETDIAENIRAIRNAIKNWKANYLIIAPIDGVVTLTEYWSENHVVSAGERLATVVPGADQTVICRAMVPSSGIGKVEPGQKANLKLSGYPFRLHGMLRGTVKTISLVPEGDGYVVEIDLKEGMKSNYSEQLKLIQEMDGTVEIITRKSRLINRFINPLKSQIKERS